MKSHGFLDMFKAYQEFGSAIFIGDNSGGSQVMGSLPPVKKREVVDCIEDSSFIGVVKGMIYARDCRE